MNTYRITLDLTLAITRTISARSLKHAEAIAEDMRTEGIYPPDFIGGDDDNWAVLTTSPTRSCVEVIDVDEL